MAKNKSDIQEKDIKTKPKKTKKVETEKVENPVDEKIDDVKVDVEQSLIAVSKLAEIDLRSYNHSNVVNGYIRHKRSI